MRILFYSTKDFEQEPLLKSNEGNFYTEVTERPLSLETVCLSEEFDCISVFTGDDVSAAVIEKLYEKGIRYITTRAAGYDNIDLAKAKQIGIRVANVPAYSPHSIAEHALALILALNRRLVTANQQVREYNFKMNNLIGFDLFEKTVGVVGTGRIGNTLIKILHGLGCHILGYDITPDEELISRYNVKYTDLNTLCRNADIISIHTCLTPETRYLINKDNIALMKPGVMLINTSRGACVNTQDVVDYLQKGHIGYFGTDVYEKEKGIFFYDWSSRSLEDELLKKLLTLPNVLVTPHQAFATHEAIGNIADTTFYNIGCWAVNKVSENELFQPDLETAAAAV